MIKIWVLILFITGAWAQDFLEEGPEVILHQVFSPTAFGIKSRTTDDQDASKVIAHMKSFLLAHPRAVISRVEILTCTSDYELPQSIIAHRKPNEHLELAHTRHEMVERNFKKEYPFPVTGAVKVCGPKFNRKDLDDRFIVKESGKLYDLKFEKLLGDSAFRNQLKEEALIERPESLKSLYPSPFLAKYKPFQGIRLTIWGHHKEERKKEIKSKQPSGKNQ